MGTTTHAHTDARTHARAPPIRRTRAHRGGNRMELFSFLWNQPRRTNTQAGITFTLSSCRLLSPWLSREVTSIKVRYHHPASWKSQFFTSKCVTESVSTSLGDSLCTGMSYILSLRVSVSLVVSQCLLWFFQCYSVTSNVSQYFHCLLQSCSSFLGLSVIISSHGKHPAGSHKECH